MIQLRRPGDRIFLFGFSRAAYTLPRLDGVLSLCGMSRPAVPVWAAILKRLEKQ
jgi:uncharacterized protein (DUF2235 family)